MSRRGALCCGAAGGQSSASSPRSSPDARLQSTAGGPDGPGGLAGSPDGGPDGLAGGSRWCTRQAGSSERSAREESRADPALSLPRAPEDPALSASRHKALQTGRADPRDHLHRSPDPHAARGGRGAEREADGGAHLSEGGRVPASCEGRSHTLVIKTDTQR
ncbi:hypothetical protein CesoFtcFv8_025134 [Champsocephalus esox]|uniref:Uncharacterized protein n=1 Tax=Champsocephalus esox TaxID=159716 RepID=A0AAN8B390_9TELE|nr:hypothetical protein CesoFtcFv8_025134 [Champsocephalus esox]